MVTGCSCCGINSRDSNTLLWDRLRSGLQAHTYTQFSNRHQPFELYLCICTLPLLYLPLPPCSRYGNCDVLPGYASVSSPSAVAAQSTPALLKHTDPPLTSRHHIPAQTAAWNQTNAFKGYQRSINTKLSCSLQHTCEGDSVIRVNLLWYYPGMWIDSSSERASTYNMVILSLFIGSSMLGLVYIPSTFSPDVHSPLNRPSRQSLLANNKAPCRRKPHSVLFILFYTFKCKTGQQTWSHSCVITFPLTTQSSENSPWKAVSSSDISRPTPC